MKKKNNKRKKNNKLPVRQVSEEEAARLAIVNTQAVIYPRAALQELTKKQLPYIKFGDPIGEETWKNIKAVSLAHGAESGLFLAENTPKEYKSLAIKMKDDLEKEFNCDKIHEKALVDQIINGYIKNLYYSWLLSAGQKFEFYDNTKNGYFCFLSKECDRAFRQFTSALEMLKNLKQPSVNLKLNIKSVNAFVADKQQFNNNQKKEKKNQ